MRPQTLLRLLSGSLLAIFALTASALAAHAGVTVAVNPTTQMLPVGGTRQMTATVTGAANTAVTWTVNDIAGGNATVGTIDASGKYTAPAALPPGYNVTIKAVSVADPTASAACVTTVRNQIPYVTAVTPNQLPFGPFTLTVIGSCFVNGAQVLWNGTPLATNYVSATQLTATGSAAQAGSFNVTVDNPGPEAISTALPVTVASGISVSVAPATVTLQPGGMQQFQAVVTNSADQSVIWKVNNVAGGDPTNGTIDAAGKYTAPNAIPATGFVTVTAVSVADSTTKGTATVSIQDPLAVTYGRFLDQATFGQTGQSMAHIRQTGIQGWLDEQFATPESVWPSAATATKSGNIDAFFGNALNGQDQLRQRVIFGLSEIFVVAANKNYNADMVAPWLQLLSRNAFGNYRTLLKELTLDASMAFYLDLANSAKPSVSGGANENYAREVMQLFSIGLYRLNQDGTYQLDANNQPLPTYTQADVQQLARALTGWTYSNANGTSGAGGNYNYYPGPMIAVPSRHDTGTKTLFATTMPQPSVIPAGQTIQQDLDAAIDILFNHPNVAPFMATRLIRALVTSNPTPGYISRVAAVFNNNGLGTRGDLKAVVQAILLDPEARNDVPPSDFGRLRTPVQHTVALARALNLPLGQASQVNYLFYSMGEAMLDAPSVFGHYSPLFRIPKTTLAGPEFQIYTASEAVNRGNYLYGLIYNPWPINPALQPFINLAGNPTALLNAVDNTLLYGRMPPATRTAILNALPAQSDNNQRVLLAIYLTAMSGDFLIQH